MKTATHVRILAAIGLPSMADKRARCASVSAPPGYATPPGNNGLRLAATFGKLWPIIPSAAAHPSISFNTHSQ